MKNYDAYFDDSIFDAIHDVDKKTAWSFFRRQLEMKITQQDEHGADFCASKMDEIKKEVMNKDQVNLF